MGGDKSEIAYACRRYAKAGYFTAAMNYSLIDLENNKSNIPMMLDEIGLCLGKIREKTAELGYRIDKVALSGFSAGGHLALLYAYSRSESSPLPIAFVAEQVGPVSFVEGWDDAEADSPEKISEAIKLVETAAGREIGEDAVLNGEARGIMASISPLQLVNENTPPTVMGYGGKDWLVPLENGEKLAAPSKSRAWISYLYAIQTQAICWKATLIRRKSTVKASLVSPKNISAIEELFRRKKKRGKFSRVFLQAFVRKPAFTPCRSFPRGRRRVRLRSCAPVWSCRGRAG